MIFPLSHTGRVISFILKLSFGRIKTKISNKQMKIFGDCKIKLQVYTFIKLSIMIGCPYRWARSSKCNLVASYVGSYLCTAVNF